MSENEIQSMLGLAFLENHPRLEVMQNLVRIALHLEPEAWRGMVLNYAERIYLPETLALRLESRDMVFLALMDFCETCVQARFERMKDQDLRSIWQYAEKILIALEEEWRTGRASSASKAANTALDWLSEALMGRNLSPPELAVVRGFSFRRRNIRTK